MNTQLNLENTRSVLVNNELFTVEEVSMDLRKVSHPTEPSVTQVEDFGNVNDKILDKVVKIKGFCLTEVDE